MTAPGLKVAKFRTRLAAHARSSRSLSFNSERREPGRFKINALRKLIRLKFQRVPLAYASGADGECTGPRELPEPVQSQCLVNALLPKLVLASKFVGESPKQIKVRRDLWWTKTEVRRRILPWWYLR